MILPVIALLGVVLFANSQLPPPLASTMELAAWSRCEIPMIAYYVGQRVEYAPQAVWLPADAVIAAGRGDCKGKAVVARDALLACGHEARVVILRTGTGKATKRHAIAVYTDAQGRRGYVDDNYYNTYDPGTAWADLIAKRWRGWSVE